MFYGRSAWFWCVGGVTVGIIGIVLIVEVVISIDSLLVVFTRLHLATIALLSETKIEVIAFHTDPILIGVLSCRSRGGIG